MSVTCYPSTMTPLISQAKVFRRVLPSFGIFYCAHASFSILCHCECFAQSCVGSNIFLSYRIVNKIRLIMSLHLGPSLQCETRPPVIEKEMSLTSDIFIISHKLGDKNIFNVVVNEDDDNASAAWSPKHFALPLIILCVKMQMYKHLHGTNTTISC